MRAENVTLSRDEEQPHSLSQQTGTDVIYLIFSESLDHLQVIKHPEQLNSPQLLLWYSCKLLEEVQPLWDNQRAERLLSG